MFACAYVSGQVTVETALESIEANNSTLKALQNEITAEKLNNRTGLTMPGPEIEFEYLWGNGVGVPDRKLLGVSQRFDAATLFGVKRAVSESQNVMLELQYRNERMNIMLEAKELLTNIIYYNSLLKVLVERKSIIGRIEQSYAIKYEKGDVSSIDLSKIRLNISLLTSQIDNAEAEHQRLMLELQRLNGGIPLDFNQDHYGEETLSDSFEEWYSQAASLSPMLAYVQQQVVVGENRLKLSRSQGLPSLSAGYSGEFEPGRINQGFSVGISIPIWENKDKVKAARASVQAAESRVKDAEVQFYNSLQSQYAMVQSLRTSSLSLQKAIEDSNSMTLLKEALDAGEISLLDYLQESDYYYEAVTSMLTAQRDYRIELDRLKSVEL